jgi:hypothetical protein
LHSVAAASGEAACRIDQLIDGETVANVLDPRDSTRESNNLTRIDSCAQ